MRAPFDRVYSDWQPWFAWYPVRVNGKMTWLKTVCRRWSFLWMVSQSNGSAYYEYGTIFDVLKT